MGRRPRGLRAVEARCAWGHPTVISVDPVLPGPRGPEPFPTLFWLTCPVLREQIARAEAGGGVREMEALVEGDASLAGAVAADHDRCASERAGLLRGPAREGARTRGFLPVLDGSGVAGSRDRRHVKCLHAHYAFHLARGGALGPILASRYGLAECPEGDVRCNRPGAAGGGDR